MYAPLRRAAVQGINDIRLETDNYQAYMTIKHLRDGVAASIFDITNQLDTLIRDESRIVLFPMSTLPGTVSLAFWPN